MTYAALYRNLLVVLDEDVEGVDDMSADTGKQPDDVWIYNLASGRRTAVNTLDGAPRPSPYAAQSHIDQRGRYYYLAQNRGGFSNCVGEVDLNTLRARTVHCVTPPQVIFWLGSAGTGVTWTETRSSHGKPCRSSRWFDGATVRGLGPANSCGTFDNAVLGGWRFWNIQGIESFNSTVPLVASDGKITQNLGPMRPQNLTVCGSYAYWLVQEVRAPSRMVRWKPGSAVQDVYTAEQLGDSSPDDVVLAASGCSDGHLSIAVTRFTGDGFTARLLEVR